MEPVSIHTIHSLYTAKMRAAQNLNLANANIEKNYYGEKGDEVAEILLNAVREYEAADKALMRKKEQKSEEREQTPQKERE